MEGEGQVIGINYQNDLVTIRQDNGEFVEVSLAADTIITSRPDGQTIESINKVAVGNQVVIKKLTKRKK